MADVTVDPLSVDTEDILADPISLENAPFDPVPVDKEDIGRVSGTFRVKFWI